MQSKTFPSLCITGTENMTRFVRAMQTLWLIVTIDKDGIRLAATYVTMDTVKSSTWGVKKN